MLFLSSLFAFEFRPLRRRKNLWSDNPECWRQIDRLSNAFLCWYLMLLLEDINEAEEISTFERKGKHDKFMSFAFDNIENALSQLGSAYFVFLAFFFYSNRKVHIWTDAMDALDGPHRAYLISLRQRTFGFNLKQLKNKLRAVQKGPRKWESLREKRLTNCDVTKAESLLCWGAVPSIKAFHSSRSCLHTNQYLCVSLKCYTCNRVSDHDLPPPRK